MPNGDACFNVSAMMPGHDKILAVGGDAGWLFICILAHCKLSRKDGVFRVAAVPGMSDRRQPLKLLTLLASENLVHEPGHDCGTCPQPMAEFRVVHDWLSWQGSAADDDVRREAKEAGGSYGNHRRWHVGRGVTDSSCGFCTQSLNRLVVRSHDRSDELSVKRPDIDRMSDTATDRITDRDPNRISDGSDDGTLFHPHTPPITRVDITPYPPSRAAASKRSRRQAYDYSADLDFLRFWDVYPVKSGKPAAFKAWLAAIARDAKPEHVIAAAIRYRDDPNRNPDKTKYPQGWLNDERYNDEPTTGTSRERNFDF